MTTILIVDDDVANRYLLECLLVGHGYKLVSASNGQEALDCIADGVPDLVVADILMPVMDGFGLCRRMKQDTQLRAIPFIFYTATYTDAKDEQFALSLGADLFVVKPADPNVLLARIQETLQKKESGTLPQSATTLSGEAPFLQQYNQTLVRKLEQKVVELEESNRRLLVKDQALQSSISGILFAELSGRITYVNPAFTRICGCEEADCRQKELKEFFDHERDALMVAKEVGAVGGWRGELKMRHKDGSSFDAQVVAHVVRDAQSEPICLMISCTDITEQRRMREALQRSQRLESLSVFAAGTAHDFNNLLTGLFGSMELAHQSSLTATARAAQYATLCSVFEKARDLTQRLLAFAKGSPPKRRPVRIRELVDECCSLSLSGSATRCEIEDSSSAGSVQGDATQMSQVFNNVIINARQAMSDAGNLKVTITDAAVEADGSSSLAPGRYVVVRIRDKGPGIPADILPRVFDPFFTTKPGGTGLGLASSYAIVRDHGGEIEITSTEGGGTTVEVWLPATHAQGTDVKRPAAPPSGTGSERILVMDDEALIRNLTHRMLNTAGYDVSTAANGESAIALYEEAMAQARPFRLVVLDLTVRGGLGGIETLNTLRRIDPHVVAVASSGYADDATAARVREVGFIALLGKPYLSYEFLSTIRGALGGRDGRTSGSG